MVYFRICTEKNYLSAYISPTWFPLENWNAFPRLGSKLFSTQINLGNFCSNLCLQNSKHVTCYLYPKSLKSEKKSQASKFWLFPPSNHCAIVARRQMERNCWFLKAHGGLTQARKSCKAGMKEVHTFLNHLCMSMKESNKAEKSWGNLKKLE